VYTPHLEKSFAKKRLGFNLLRTYKFDIILKGELKNNGQRIDYLLTET
jgi:hypothetical protein